MEELTLFDEISAAGLMEEVRLRTLARTKRPELHRNTVREALKVTGEVSGLRAVIQLVAKKLLDERQEPQPA